MSPAKSLGILFITTLIPAAGAASAYAQTPSGEEILAAAAQAARTLRSVTYEAEEETRSGNSHRIVTGQVRIAAFDFSSPRRHKVAVEGGVVRSDRSEPEAFHVVYDGESVRRLIPEADVVLVAYLGQGGEAVLEGTGASLVVRDLLAAEPFAAERGASLITYAGREDVNGEPCDVVAAEFGDPPTTTVWYFGVDDLLPRKRERRYTSALGNEVTAVLTLRSLETDITVENSAFALELPAGYTERTVARKRIKAVNTGELAPSWTLKDGDGREHSLSDYRGKLVILDFWATWCPHCRKALPAMQRLHEDYADQGVAILGVNCRERKKNIDPGAFARARGVTYPILLGGNSIAPQYRVKGIPAFYVIGPDGKLLFKSSGFNQAGERRLESFIKRHVQSSG